MQQRSQCNCACHCHRCFRILLLSEVLTQDRRNETHLLENPKTKLISCTHLEHFLSLSFQTKEWKVVVRTVVVNFDLAKMPPLGLSKHFQYLVLGGGSGGIASARRAAEFGVSVALIENGPLGGTCVSLS